MGSVSKERLFGATIKAAEQRAREARRIEQRMPLQAVLGAARLRLQARPSGAAAAQQGYDQRRRRALVPRRPAEIRN